MIIDVRLIGLIEKTMHVRIVVKHVISVCCVYIIS